MHSSLSVRGGIALAIFAAIAPVAASAQQSPVRLRLPEAARIDGQSFALETNQVVEIDYHGALHSAERGVHFGFRFSGSSAEGTDRVSTSLGIDSLRLRLVTPHGEDFVHTPGFEGSSLALAYARRGGPAAYVHSPPLLDFSDMGGSLPLTALIDPVFPGMPQNPVKVGESWEHWWTRTQIDGGELSVRQVSSRYVLAGLETRAGKTVARIEVTTRADAARGVAGEGAISATGVVLIRVEDGVVLEVSSEESVTGRWSFNGEDLPYKQTNKMRLVNTVAAGSD